MDLFGRTIIYSDVDFIDKSNVIDVLYTALQTHGKNANEIDYLYNYYTGKQAVLDRRQWKKIRPEICNIIVENRAYEIVNFNTAFLCGKPIQYISRETAKRSVSENISNLNSMMMFESKVAKDKELVDWMHICGTGYRLVLPNPDYPYEDSPFQIHILDPRRTFVIYSSKIGNKPLAGVYYTINSKNEKIFNLYTNDTFFEIKGDDILRIEPYTLKKIPIIEYPANFARLGSFEPVITLLDAINEIDSNRLDGVEQFIQSLAVAVNCEFDKEVTANDIMRAGLLVLSSIGENKADFKILSEQLDQSQTQTLKDDLYQAILTIIGMPSQANGTNSDSSNNGAVIMRNGWYNAESQAENRENMFKLSEREFLKLVLNICKELSDIDLKSTDILIKFTRRNYEDIVSKSTVLTTLLNNDKVAPIDAYTVCGLFPDPEDGCARGLEWYEKQKNSENEKSNIDKINIDNN